MNRPGDFVPGLLLWEWQSPETVVSGRFGGWGYFFLLAAAALPQGAGDVVHFGPLPQLRCGTLGFSRGAYAPLYGGGSPHAPAWGLS